MRSLSTPGSTQRLQTHLERWAETPDRDKLFGWEWRLAQNLARPIATIRKVDRPTAAVEYSPDGKYLAIGEQSLMLLDPDTLAVLKEWNCPGNVKDLRWEPTGSRMAISSQDRVTLFDTVTGRSIWQQPAQVNPRMIWDPQSRWVAFSNEKRRCLIAESDTGKAVKTLTQIDEAFAFSPDGKTFVAAIITPDQQHHLQFWHTSDWSVAKTVPVSRDFVFALAWSPDSHQLAVGNAVGAVIVLDPATGTRLQSLDATGRACHSLAWRADGRWLASQNFQGEIRVWECDTWAEVPLSRETEQTVAALRWRPATSQLVAGSGDPQLRVWNLQEQHAYWKFPFGTRLTNTSYLSCVWHPDSQSLAGSGAAPGTIVWAVDGRRLQHVNGVEWQWSGDGKYNASVLGEFVFVRDSTGKPVAKVELPGQPKVLAWQPRTHTLAIRTANRLHFWRPTTGAAPELIFGEPLREGMDFINGNAMAWSPDGSRLAFSEKQTQGSITCRVHIMNVADRSIRKTFAQAKTQIFALAWSPDGEQLGIGRDESTARIYDAASGEEIVALTGHGGAIRSIMWHPTDTRLATGSVDGTAKVWDTLQNRAVVTFDLGAVVRQVAWSPDGGSLAAAAESGTIHVWNSHPRDPPKRD
jgi:WD40 repeat protein